MNFVLRGFACSKLIISLLFIVLSAQSFSQNKTTLYFMKDLPQKINVDPTYQLNTQKIYIGVPFLNSIGFSLDNSIRGLNYTTISNSQPDMLGGIVNDLGSNECIKFNVGVSIFDAGIKIKDDWYLSFGLGVNIKGGFNIAPDLLRFAYYGNGSEELLGKQADFSGLSLNAVGYTDFTVGISKAFLDRQLIVGVRAKLLLGISKVGFGMGAGSGILTDPDNYEIHAKVNPYLITAGLVGLSLPNQKMPLSEAFKTLNFGLSDITKLSNLGFATDIGISSHLFDNKLHLSASITDLGFIIYKNNNVIASGPQEFKIDYVLGSNGSTILDELGNKVLEIEVEDKTTLKDKYILDFTVNIGAVYDVCKYFNVGALYSMETYLNKAYHSFTAGISTQSLPVNLTATYKISNNRFDNLSAGVVFGRKGFQFYAMCDNIIGAIKWKQAESASLRFGLNMMFGKKTAPIDMDIKE